MFCITGIFKCFTPHEDARRATPRHATPRRPAIYASLSYDSFFLSFRLPNQPSSNFLASFVAVFPLLPLYSLLFFSLFSTDQQHPQSACANWSSPPARAKQLYPREEEKERKKYQFFSFEYLRRALGIKFSFFFLLLSSFSSRLLLFYSRVQSFFAWISRNVSMPAAQRIRTSIIEYFAPNDRPSVGRAISPLLLGQLVITSARRRSGRLLSSR